MWRLLTLALVLLLTNEALAQCHSFFVRSPVVKKVVVQEQQVLAVKVPVYYGVGSSLQYQALQQRTEDLAGFQEFLTAWQQFKNQQQPSAASSNSIVAEKCGKCHGTQLSSPKGGVFLSLSGGLTPDLITKSLRMVRDDKMPPGNPLTASEKAQLMEELLNNERKDE